MDKLQKMTNAWSGKEFGIKNPSTLFLLYNTVDLRMIY